MQLAIQNCELRETVNFKAFGERILYLDVGQKGVAALTWHVEAGAIVVAFHGSDAIELVAWGNVKRARPVEGPATLATLAQLAGGDSAQTVADRPKRPRGRPRKHPVVSDA